MLEKLGAQLACEGKESSLAGWCPQVSTLGCSGWTGLIQNPAGMGTGRSEAAGCAGLATLKRINPPCLHISTELKGARPSL